MRIRLGIDGYAASDAVLIESLKITQDSTQGISTADITLFQAYGFSRYDVAEYNHAAFVYEWSIQEWSEIILWDEDTAQILFAGFALTIDHAMDGPHLKRQVSASDYGILLDRAIITQEWPDGTPDSTIVADLLRVVPEIQPGLIVTQVAQLGDISVKDEPVRDVLDNLCALTGGEWHVTYDGKLTYYRIGSIAPPYGLSDHPDGVNTIGFTLDDYKIEFSQGANRILVLGSVTDTGEITSLAEDHFSQQRYGLLSTTLVDRTITDVETARLWGQTELAQRAWPTPALSVSVYVPGLARGQSVLVESLRYGVAGTYVLRSLTLVIMAPDPLRPAAPGHRLKYTAELGVRMPDMVYTLLRMQRRAPERTKALTATIPPGSIDGDDFAPGIEPIYSVSRKPEGAEWALYPLDAVFFNTTDRQLYRRTGDDWTTQVPISAIEGQIAANQILLPGSVTATTLADGSVVTAKIPDGAIQAPKLAAQSVTANAIAANAIYAEAVQANAIRSIHLISNAVTAGKIDALAVQAGNIAANAVIAGTIAAAAVRAGNLAAGAVTAGTIAAGSIRAQDSVFATAAIQNADIATLSGGKITANSITSDKLNTIEIAVGYSSPVPNKPGRFGVYGPSGLIGLIGDLGGAGMPSNTYFGIWSKLGSFGGTGYADAPIYSDQSGNLFIRNAQFLVTVGTQSVQIVPNAFDPGYSSLGMKVADGTNYTWFVGRGSATYNNAGQVVAACVTHPTDTQAGQIYCVRPGTANAYCMMDGQLGVIRCDNYYQYQGRRGRTVTFTAASGQTITVRGGIITED